MNIIDIINKKRLKQELTDEEIKYVVNGFLVDEIKDYQMSSLLMAIVLNGMTARETIDLTDIMIKSGDVLDLSKIDGIIVDKHSTGGVGDKVTLVLGPLLASLGIKIAKMSGRGLGHTGGTIDKLESIEGFNTKLTEKKFIKQVNDINIAFMKVFRNQKGRDATMVFEVDHEVTAEIIGNVKAIEGINKVIMINPIKDGE